MKWINNQKNRRILCKMAKKYNISEMLAQVLINRNLTDEELDILFNRLEDAFLNPYDLINCEAGAKLIIPYLKDKNALIVIRADYDADGITSGYVLGDGLSYVADCEINVSYPERSEGYGLKMPFCEDLINLKATNKYSKILLITVDNGIAAYEEIKYLKENNITTLVIDHHNPKETLPDCIVIDPWKDEDETFRHLCGVGLAFKFIQILFNEYDIVDELNQYLTAVTIGTIADMMPMTLENIAFCVYGINQINSDECPQGIQALKQYLGKKELSFTDIGWEIGPRINACGRMDDVQLASKLFFNDELSYYDLLDNIIPTIDSLNTKRKELTNTKTTEIIKSINDKDSVIVAITTDCPEGLAGVIVNKLIAIYNKPCIVFIKKDDLYVGSARSVNDINMLDILNKEQEEHNTILNYGGHEQAAGIAITEDSINEFKEHMATLKLNTDLIEEDKEIELNIDATIELKDVNMENVTTLNYLPYDKEKFIEPVFETEVVIANYNYTAKKDKIWLYITDHTMNENKTLKLLLMNETMNQFLNLKNKHKVKLAGTLTTDFLTQGRTATIRIIDMKEAE